MLKPHRKTRTGCTQCKRRRVKCDERKPSCANCGRNHLPCSLEFLTPINSISRSRATARPSPGELYSFSTKLNREILATPFDARTSELLYHYVTVVSGSFGGEQKPTTWRDSMPQLGLTYPFLLSGIIAISALHLAKLLPYRKQELLNSAVAQQSAALPSFRASIARPNAESIHATFAFAGSVVYYIMASPEDINGVKMDRCRIPSKADKYPHWFQTMRGLMALLSSHWDALTKGPFSTLLSNDPDLHYLLDNPDDSHLAKLEEMFPTSSPSPLSLPISVPPPSFRSSPAHLLSQDGRKVEVCREALKELRRVVALTHLPDGILSSEASLRVWVGNIRQDFIELIYERDPRALVILAHYCVLLKREDHLWYMTGLGPGLLENIWQALGEEWRPWIQWPMEQPVSKDSKVMLLTSSLRSTTHS